jgi:hypothetical protein
VVPVTATRRRRPAAKKPGALERILLGIVLVFFPSKHVTNRTRVKKMARPKKRRRPAAAAAARRRSPAKRRTR